MGKTIDDDGQYVLPVRMRVTPKRKRPFQVRATALADRALAAYAAAVASGTTINEDVVVKEGVFDLVVSDHDETGRPLRGTSLTVAFARDPSNGEPVDPFAQPIERKAYLRAGSGTGAFRNAVLILLRWAHQEDARQVLLTKLQEALQNLPKGSRGVVEAESKRSGRSLRVDTLSTNELRAWLAWIEVQSKKPT